MIDGKENEMARLVISVMGSIAQMERNRIAERSKEGITIAKAEGKYKGRKLGSVQSRQRTLERHEMVVKKLNKGLSVREIASMCNVSTTTVMKVKKILKEGK